MVRFRTCGTAEEPAEAENQQNSPKKPGKYTEKNPNQRRRIGRTRGHVQKTKRKARKNKKNHKQPRKIDKKNPRSLFQLQSLPGDVACVGSRSNAGDRLVYQQTDRGLCPALLRLFQMWLANARNVLRPLFCSLLSGSRSRRPLFADVDELSWCPFLSCYILLRTLLHGTILPRLMALRS